MRILVFSDSHGHKRAMEDAVLEYKPDIILHLGDYSSDCAHLRDLFPELEVRGVRGNCDMCGNEPLMDEFMLGGKRFFMTHGHFYKVKLGLDAIINNALARGADVLLFGHTHVPVFKNVSGMLAINPGAAAHFSGTYAVLDIAEGDIHVQMIGTTIDTK